MREEIWKPCLDGYYEVSNLGSVRRIKAARTTGVLPRLLKPQRGKNYLIVTVTLGSVATRQSVMIHTLVAEAFLGRRPPDRQINHIDGNKHNNWDTNLEYVTRSGNALHAASLGVLDKPRAWSREQMEAVRDGVINAERQATLAKRFDIPINRVEKIVMYLRRRERQHAYCR